MLTCQIATQPNFTFNLASLEESQFCSETPNSTENPASAEEVIKAFQEGTNALCDIFNGVDDAALRDQLEDFAIFVASQLTGLSPELSTDLRKAVLQDFSELCFLAKNPKLRLDARRTIVKNLVDDCDVCVPGIIQNIEAANKELKVLSHGVGQHFVNELITAIDNHNIDFMPSKNLSASSQGNKDPVAYEKHFGAALFNAQRKFYNLPRREDAFLNNPHRPFRPTIKQYEDSSNSLWEKVSAESVIRRMAEDYLERVQDFYAKKNANAKTFDATELGQRWLSFKNELEPELKLLFGPIEQESLFLPCAGEDELYQLTKDSTLIARGIARNLRAVNVLKEFKAEYLVGEKNPDPRLHPHSESGIKLKKLGDGIAYISKTSVINGHKTRLQQPIAQYAWGNPVQGVQIIRDFDSPTFYERTGKSSGKVMSHFYENLHSFLLGEMQEASSTEEQSALYEKAMLFYTSEYRRHAATVKIIEQAGVRRQHQIVDLLFSKLKPEEITIEFALQYQQNHIVKEFIKTKTPEQIFISGHNDSSVLESALKFKNTEIAKYLIDQMSAEQLSETNSIGDTLLHLVIAYHPEMAEYVVAACKNKIAESEKLQILFNINNNKKYTPMDLALRFKQRDCVKILLDEISAEQLYTKDSTGNSTLHWALRYFPEMAMLFVEKIQKAIPEIEKLRCHLNKSNVVGDTPLMSALLTNQHDLAMFLIKTLDKEQFDKKNNIGATALIYSIFCKNFIAAKSLIDKLDVNQLMQYDNKKNTPLLMSLSVKNPELAQHILQILLMNLGQKEIEQHLAHQDINGNNALIAAVKTGLLDIADYIHPLMNKDDLGLQDNDKNTALMVALLHKEFSFANTLNKYMNYEQIRLRNNSGKIARHIALANGYTQMAAELKSKAGFFWSLLYG